MILVDPAYARVCEDQLLMLWGDFIPNIGRMLRIGHVLGFGNTYG